MKKRPRIILITSIVIVALIISSIIFLAYVNRGPMLEVYEYLESDQYVHVTTNKWYVFTPSNQSFSFDVAFVFYPGGKVNPKSYAPLAYFIAKEGFLSIIVPVLFDLAVLSPNRATNVINAFPDVDNWIIGGHSLGGAMAARYVYNNPEKINGLVLLASYPPESNNLSSYELDVLSIYASEDLVVDKNITETSNLLPNNTKFYEIIGGNHAYFGYYGEQRGDGRAFISREEQMNQTIREIRTFLQNYTALFRVYIAQTSP